MINLTLCFLAHIYQGFSRFYLLRALRTLSHKAFSDFYHIVILFFMRFTPTLRNSSLRPALLDTLGGDRLNYY
jgi:hypothetical protein